MFFFHKLPFLIKIRKSFIKSIPSVCEIFDATILKQQRHAQNEKTTNAIIPQTINPIWPPLSAKLDRKREFVKSKVFQTYSLEF